MINANLRMLGLAAVVCVTIAGLLLLTGRLLARLPIGFTSRWHVPTSTVHNGLRYSIVKPVQCRSRQSVEHEFRVRGLRRLASDNGFSRVTAEPTDHPGYLWLVPTGQTCLVAYNQFHEVG